MSVASAQPATSRSAALKPGAAAPVTPAAGAVAAAASDGPVLRQPAPDLFRSGAGNSARLRSADEARAEAMLLREASRAGYQADRSPAAESPTHLDRALEASSPYGPALQLGGVSIERIAPQPTPLNSAQQTAVNLGAMNSLAFPPGLGFKDWRSADTAREVVNTPVVTGKDGKPLAFGDLSLYISSGGNMSPSAAQVFRVAQHSGKVVVAFQNNLDPAKRVLREAKEFDGVPVPPDLRGKIFVIGDPDNRNFIGHAQASDAFLEQLGQIHQQKDLLGVDVLQSKATLFGHSQGGHHGLMSRDRLEKAGLQDTIGQFVAIGTGWRGKAHQGFDLQAKAMLESVKLLGPAPDMERMVNGTVDADLRSKDFPQAMIDKNVDLSVAGIIGSPAKPVLKWGFPPKLEWEHNNIRPQLRVIGGLGGLMNGKDMANAALGGDDDSDGLLPTSISREAPNFKLLEKPHDHAGLFEDPDVVDQVLRRLKG